MKNKYVEAYEVIAEMQDIDSALAFLETLPKSEYVNFGKELVKLAKYGDDGYIVKVSERHSRWERNKPQEYVEVLFYGCLKTCSYTTFKKHRSWNDTYFFKSQTEAFLEQNCPEWLTRYFNEEVSEWSLRHHYFTCKKYQQKGFLKALTPERQALALAALPNRYKRRENRKEIFDIEKFNHEISENFELIKLELPLLFQFENGFGEQYDFTREDWYRILKKWSEEGKIERTDLIKWTFETFHRPFNRQAAAVYRKFLDYLELSNEELLHHQQAFFEMLSNANPHHVSYALKTIKKIEKLKGFNHEDLVENLEAILVDDSKGTVKNALMLLERTAKKRKDLTSKICQISLFALVSEEVDIQERVWKILDKYAASNDEELSDELSIFFENIHASLRPKFQIFLTENVDLSVEETVEFEPKTIDILSDEFRVLYIENWKDWIYEAGAIYENKDAKVIDFERLIEGFVRLMSSQNDAILPSLEPIAQRIEKTIGRHWDTSPRYIGTFILCVHHYFKHQPKTWKSYEDAIRKILKTYLNYSRSSLLRRDLYQRFLVYLNLGFQQVKLPILNVPTHHNCWINPEIFVDKILHYQAANQQPNIHDLSYAICRLSFLKTEVALAKAEKIKGNLGELIRWILKGEINKLSPEVIKSLKPKLLSFPTRKPNNSITQTYDDKDVVIWYNALRSRFPMQDVDAFLGLKFGKYANTAQVQQYNWSTFRENDKYGYHRLQVKYSKRISEKNHMDLPIYFKYNRLTYEYSISHFLLQMEMAQTPNNSEKIFGEVTPDLSSWQYNYEDTTSNTTARALLKSMIANNILVHEMSLLFLSFSLNFKDKISRGIATEAIIYHLNQAKIEAKNLGENLGIITAANVGQLQRIIPCLQQISEVSRHHALFIKTTLEEMLTKFPTDTLPRNTKKLLELLVNIALSENEKINANLFEKQVEFWKTKSGLKKLVKNF